MSEKGKWRIRRAIAWFEDGRKIPMWSATKNGSGCSFHTFMEAIQFVRWQFSDAATYRLGDAVELERRKK